MRAGKSDRNNKMLLSARCLEATRILLSGPPMTIKTTTTAMSRAIGGFTGGCCRSRGSRCRCDLLLGRRSYSATGVVATKDHDLVKGFESICLHGGHLPDPTTHSRGVLVHRTTAYDLGSAERAAKLFALTEPGNIYST